MTLRPLQGDPPDGWQLEVNNDYHQLILDLSDEGAARSPTLASWRRVYDLPYAKLRAPPHSVLVMGAGTGNDVAAALRAGAGHVDAVEIDPLILDMGRRLHPERPYARPEVVTHCTDARAFFRRTREAYDLVVFGFLDSHAPLSSLSSVRLDSYVYTVESLREARRLLAPGGVIALTFSVEQDWIGRRLFLMLEETCGEPPLVEGTSGTGATVFLAGPGLLRPSLPGATSPGDAGARARGDVPPATDAWPFLYFRSRSLPAEYVVVLVVIAALSVVSVGACCTRAAVRPEPVLFALGAGFMLLETRAVTVTALLLGSTWTTNALVFASILLLALLSTVWTARHRAFPGTPVVGGLLVVTVLGVAAFPLDAMIGKPTWLTLLSAAVPVAPLFFAGILFARAFAGAADPQVALGSNLPGAVAGGLGEYASLLLGFPALVYIALGFYAVALVAWRRAGP
jgi:SAM-dependent methyltransferase